MGHRLISFKVRELIHGDRLDVGDRILKALQKLRCGGNLGSIFWFRAGYFIRRFHLPLLQSRFGVVS